MSESLRLILRASEAQDPYSSYGILERIAVRESKPSRFWIGVPRQTIRNFYILAGNLTHGGSEQVAEKGVSAPDESARSRARSGVVQSRIEHDPDPRFKLAAGDR
jgi:hypothetical protein